MSVLWKQNQFCFEAKFIINGNENWLSMGMLATKNNPNDIKVNIRDVFETIPDNVNEKEF